MNLRRQLLLVSLLTLVLPWAGCEFIRETESALRQSQQQMLSGTAKAVAESLERYPEEFPAPPDQGGSAGDQLYGHHLDAEPVIDGYFNDWPSGPVSWMLGRRCRDHRLELDIARIAQGAPVAQLASGWFGRYHPLARACR